MKFSDPNYRAMIYNTLKNSNINFATLHAENTIAKTMSPVEIMFLWLSDNVKGFYRDNCFSLHIWENWLSEYLLSDDSLIG